MRAKALKRTDHNGVYSAHPTERHVISPGTIVGDKYRLEAPIGQGGMATVWRAVHTTLDRPVAVKFLEAVGVHARQLADRFLQEAKLAAGLRHRHVVDILDFGVLEGGQPYMVMELLEGQSLADRYEEGPPVSDWEVVEIVTMVLSGLAAVHDAGILHRDVKPENIFLVQDADGIFPKLLDFGVSKGFGGEGRITKTGAVVGTPQYMSPEQARGKKDIGLRSDLWSIGVVLYEGFTGQVPFDSENPGDVLISVATEEVPPLDELRPDLPASMIETVHRALSKNPEDRFNDAREMRDALMAILEGDEIMTGRPDSGLIRLAYSPGPGTGKLRILSASAPPPAPARATDPFLVPTAPRLPAEAAELASEKLRPPRSSTPAQEPRNSSWRTALFAIGVVAIAAAAFLALDGWGALVRAGLVPGAIAHGDSGASGVVRPGDAVVSVSSPPPEDGIEPPPTNGVGAPDSETVDVPSPPDPPDQVPARALGDEPLDSVDAGLDGGADAGLDGGIDAGPPAAPAGRRRRRPRRPR
jgi:serine/threonine protein kinase